jgi:hypothetical protein
MIEIGVTKSTGLTVYYSLDQVKFVAYYKRQHGPIDLKPAQIATEIMTKREMGDHRRFVMIVEGDLNLLQSWRSTMHEFDIAIYVGKRDDVEKLGIIIVDANWDRDDRQISLNQILG